VTFASPVPSSTIRVPSESRQKKIDPTFSGKSGSVEMKLLLVYAGKAGAVGGGEGVVIFFFGDVAV